MTRVFFKPWVGFSYADKGFNGKRVLVVGDSHACNDCAECGDLSISDKSCRELTTKTISDFLNYKQSGAHFAHWMNTFTKFTNAICGRGCSANQTQEFWDSVAFYNYVQFATDRPRKAPSNKQYDDSEPAFVEVLGKLTPQLVIVWGKRLWHRMPDLGGYAESDFVVDEISYGRLYHIELENSRRVVVFHTPHPSTPFFNKTYTRVLSELIKQTC